MWCALEVDGGQLRLRIDFNQVRFALLLVLGVFRLTCRAAGLQGEIAHPRTPGLEGTGRR